MLTKEEIEEVVNSQISIKDFCISKNISKVTFYNYARKFNIKGKFTKAKKNYYNYINKKYERWLIVKYLPNNTKSGMFECLCDCGTVQNVRIYDILNKKTTGCNSCSKEIRSKNCGKYKRKLGKDNYKFTGYEKITGYQWCVIKINAKKRNIDFDLDIKDAYELLVKQDFKCKLSGLDIELSKGFKKKSWTATLDRIDSKKGYTIDNVQWLHKDINTMKWAFSQEQFLNYCKIITEKIK